MSKLPLTVTDVTNLGGALYGVTLAFADGTTTRIIVPETMATLEAVTISALAMAVLSDAPTPVSYPPHRVHTRYDPRT